MKNGGGVPLPFSVVKSPKSDAKTFGFERNFTVYCDSIHLSPRVWCYSCINEGHHMWCRIDKSYPHLLFSTSIISFGFELIRFFFFQYELLFCIQDLEDSVSYAYVKVKFFTVVHVMHLTSIFSFQPIVVTMMMNS